MSQGNETRNCSNFMPPMNGTLYCNAYEDKLGTCWNYTKAGETAFAPCPKIASFNWAAEASKKCELNGSWYFSVVENTYWSNYSQCIQNKPNVSLVYVFFAGYSLSVLCLSISLFIFFFFKQLRCDRVTLHKNLFTCHLINAIIWINFYLVISNGDVMQRNPIHCQILFIIATYFSVGTYFWMFSEGLYLAVILILTFHRGTILLTICIVTGWGLPLILTSIYVISRYLIEKPDKCWTDPSKMYLILAIPNVVALGANLLILLFILKTLVTKLSHPTNREETQWSKTAKAVFILIPLLGLQNIIFFIYPDNQDVRIIQDYSTAILSSFQGVLVSFILCFFNHEVRTIIRRRACQHSLLQPLKTTRRGTYITEFTSNSQPRRSIGMRAFSIQSSVIST